MTAKTKMAVAAGTAALTGVAYCVVFVMPSMAVPVYVLHTQLVVILFFHSLHKAFLNWSHCSH